ncbi:hypothetical protein AVEN_111255-1 [Araneus ventricosus]|uniref:Uncharacterized protein n=1 Tax=Araneus ventricosus TaxID=182803 RepID=A0A4Y2JLW6_ARAVE|nr:hypothetical protein AVEN_111255-1 [Araneus ventricosus]
MLCPSCRAAKLCPLLLQFRHWLQKWRYDQITGISPPRASKKAAMPKLQHVAPANGRQNGRRAYDQSAGGWCPPQGQAEAYARCRCCNSLLASGVAK